VNSDKLSRIMNWYVRNLAALSSDVLIFMSKLYRMRMLRARRRVLTCSMFNLPKIHLCRDKFINLTQIHKKGKHKHHPKYSLLPYLTTHTELQFEKKRIKRTTTSRTGTDRSPHLSMHLISKELVSGLYSQHRARYTQY
jgi:hypothetical protein